ncbi:S9 family peptidase, partial [Azotobacter beijerinckii]|nr:S9 family peptidase [Azotobacter beijerinckii]
MQPMPYGSWPSRWSAADAAAASRDFAELRAGLGGLLWLQFDPQEAGCSLWLRREGEPQRLTPPGRSVRSRVYEYGGGAFCVVGDGVVLVDEADQQLYRLGVAAGSAPEALTARSHCRYGDLQFAPAWNAVLAVEESREQERVIHRLVGLGLADGTRRVLAEGADFYAAPRLSADGCRLAWIEWDRPELPWTATRLCLAGVDAEGVIGPAVTLAGAAGDESVQQPCFVADGQLTCLTDCAGWWQPWAEQGGQWHPAPEAGHPVDNGAALSGTDTAGWSEPRPMAETDHAPA